MCDTCSCGSTTGRKFDPSKPVQLRNGNPVRVLAVDVKHPAWPMVVAVRKDNGDEVVGIRTSDGRFRLSGEHPMDVVNVPVKHKKYVIVTPEELRDGSVRYYGSITLHDTVESAVVAGRYREGSIVVPIEWEG